MNMRTPNYIKLSKSAAICLVALGMILLLKSLFPSFDFVQVETTVLALTTTWIVNTVKESLG